MAGLLTSVFDDGGSSSDSSGSTQQYDAGVHGGLDLSPEIAVSHHAETSWEDQNGTEHTYSSDIDLAFDADVHTAFAAAGSLTGSSMDEG